MIQYWKIFVTVSRYATQKPLSLFRVCQVSQDWYQLSQHPPLLKQRKRYIKTLREEYQLSKENFPPPALRDNGTPQQQTSFIPSRHMTVGQSPLNVIQPKSAHRNSNRRTIVPPTSGHTQSYLSPLNETPCPAYLLENVKKLSLEDGVADLEVRRCLFPMTDVSPSHNYRNLGPGRTWNTRNSHKCSAKGELTAGKKANRNRLRRLWLQLSSVLSIKYIGVFGQAALDTPLAHIHREFIFIPLSLVIVFRCIQFSSGRHHTHTHTHKDVMIVCIHFICTRLSVEKWVWVIWHASKNN